MKKIFTLCALLLSLQGCFVAGAAAGAAAVTVIYDHRSIERINLDQRISNTAYHRIHEVPALRDDAHINVTCFNRIILLTGETNSPELRRQAEEIAEAIEGVTKVYNEISIQTPLTSLTETSDMWITAKIKTEMLATKDLKSGTIKVVTENGAVYLMGIVSHDQADAAVSIARQVSGVQKVVKIFQYSN